jgi:hypothetical protein
MDEAMSLKNQANILLEKHLRELGLDFEREFRFHPVRKWRSDYRLKAVMLHGLEILLEIEGGFYHGKSGHSGATGIQRDIDKANHALACGYLPFRFSTADVLRGRARAFLKEHLAR